MNIKKLASEFNILKPTVRKDDNGNVATTTSEKGVTLWGGMKLSNDSSTTLNWTLRKTYDSIYHAPGHAFNAIKNFCGYTSNQPDSSQGNGGVSVKMAKQSHTYGVSSNNVSSVKEQKGSTTIKSSRVKNSTSANQTQSNSVISSPIIAVEKQTKTDKKQPEQRLDTVAPTRSGNDNRKSTFRSPFSKGTEQAQKNLDTTAALAIGSENLKEGANQFGSTSKKLREETEKGQHILPNSARLFFNLK